MESTYRKMNEYLKKYKVDDLINKGAKLLFILESPHTQEIKYSYPVAGDSGIEMTKFIYSHKANIPFGKLLANMSAYSKEYDNLSNYGILNVSSAPLQKGAFKNEVLPKNELNLLDVLEKLRVNYKSKKHKYEEWNIVKQILLNKFKERLILALESNQNIEYLIPCGRFAESYFNLINEGEEIINSRKIITDIPHPSFNQWSYHKSMYRLKEILH